MEAEHAMTRSVYRHQSVRLWAHNHRRIVAATVVVVVLALAGASAFALSSRKGARARGAGPGAATTLPPSKKRFTIASTVPSASAQVQSDSPITVSFTDPVDPQGPMPSLSPAVAGSWSVLRPDTLSFDATGPLIPGTTETLTVPGGGDGVLDSAHKPLLASVTVTFTVASSTVRLQQLLAQLGYLPVTFTPTGPAPMPKEMAQPQPGTFAWRWPDPLDGLETHWEAGAFGPMTQGAIMTFEDQHGLKVDGLPEAALWTALLQAAAANQVDPKPYDYVVVNKNRPENLTLWVNGVVKFSNILVNTGIPGVDTPDGTFPVFEHLVASDMKGTNLNGTTYNDPNVPWASYFYRGDALHGFVRASYGFPQSNGCVEMSISDAGEIWPYTPIGTLVTVVGPPA
jgi:peptidoglycan hydrolase-like protein with peptidoglycan-binding domain